MLELTGFKDFIDPGDFARLAARLVLNLFFAFAVLRLVYFRVHGRREVAFTFLLLNVVTFSLCFLLRKVPIEMGFALGLFAVFGVLRYRTEPIRTRDLTYLFIFIGIAILNAVANKKISMAELLLVNSAIVGLTWLMEHSPSLVGGVERTIIYDNLELIKPGRDAELMADLRERTGLDITRVSVRDVDLLKDVARVTVFCPRPQTSKEETELPT